MSGTLTPNEQKLLNKITLLEMKVDKIDKMLSSLTDTLKEDVVHYAAEQKKDLIKKTIREFHEQALRSGGGLLKGGGV